MSESNPANPPEGEAEQVATRYIEEQLQSARSSLRRTRIICSVLIVVVVGYMTFVTTMLRNQFLRPKAAAEMVCGQVAVLVDENGGVITARLKEQIPAFIAALPDRILEQLPSYREDLENRLEVLFADYCRANVGTLEAQFDKFFEENKDAVREFLDSAQDPDAAKELGDQLEAELMVYLNEKGEDGESIQQKLDHALEMLRQVESRLARLVNATDLTPQEEKLRHAIAVIMHTTEREITPIVK